MAVFCENEKCKFRSKRRMHVCDSHGKASLVHTCAKKWITLSQLTDTDFDYDGTDTECEPNCFRCLSFENKQVDKEVK